MKYTPALFLALAAALPAFAQEMCSTHTIRGTYMVTCDGALSPAPNAPLMTTKILGTAKMTADGSVTGETTVSLGGNIAKQEVTGQSVVNSDCTGTIKYTQKIDGQAAPDLNVRFIILDSGKSIAGMAVDPGTSLSCRLERMRL